MPKASSKLKTLRLEAKLSINQLARRADLARATVSAAEQGREVSNLTFAKLMRALSDALHRPLIVDETLFEDRPHAIGQEIIRIPTYVIDRINKRVEDIRLTLSDLEDRTGISERTLRRLLRSKQSGGVRRETVQKIARALDFSYNELMRLRSSVAPTIPAQTTSAHFTIRDGLITTVPTQEFGPDDNDYRRLAALQKPLLQASNKSRTELSKNNKPFAALLDVTENYLAELDKDVNEINYAVLYAYGLQLAVAYESAEYLIKKDELPDFGLDALTSIKSVLQLHGPFILSSRDGRDLVTDAERYERNPSEERQFQADVKQFGDILRERSDLVEEKSGEFISDITAPDDGSEQFERRYLFTKGAAKNLVIVFSAGALIASTAFIPIVGPVVAASLGLLTLEAMKKSKPFNDLSAPIRKSLDDLSEMDLVRLKQIPQEQLQKLREFVIMNQDLLRRVGGSAREMRWFRDVLEWVKNSDIQNDSSVVGLEMESGGVQRISSRSPLHLVLVLDNSGSMAGKSSYDLNEAIRKLLDILRTASLGQKPSFRISIISFGSDVKVLAEAQSETEIDVDRVTTFNGDSGSTNATEALNETLRILSSSPGTHADVPAFVLLLSDGHPDDPESAKVAARRLRELALPSGFPRLVCLGLGEADDSFMSEIASSPGLYKKLQTSRDIVTVLPAIGTIGTQRVGAKEVEEAIERL